VINFEGNPERAEVGTVCPREIDEVLGPVFDRLEAFCAGHAFSRAQVRIVIETLIRRFPKLAADPARPAEFRGWEFRAPRRLDVLLQGPGR
jgi:hypothetical protein